MKRLALLALLSSTAFADPCIDQSKLKESQKKPCASWSPVTLRTDGTPLLPQDLAGYTLYWEKTADGKVSRGKVEAGKATQYFLQNANPNHSYRFWVVTKDSKGQTSDNSSVGTWGKK